MGITFISLFSGIGGLDLGLERAGWKCVAQVEKDPFALSVLRRHWPDVPKWEDVNELDPRELPAADAVVGGFPCQPFSVAGKRRGADDPRNLWPQMRKVVEVVRPRWVLAENVAGIINTYLDTVADDLEALGYTVGAFTLPAAAFGAPHLRERLFIVAQRQGRTVAQRQGRTVDQRPMAHPNGTGQHRQSVPVLQAEGWDQGNLPDAGGQGKTLSDALGVGCPWRQDLQTTALQEWLAELERSNPWPSEPGVGRVAHGVPDRVDRLRALGNAVVPQVATFIGLLINAVDDMVE